MSKDFVSVCTEYEKRFGDTEPRLRMGKTCDEMAKVMEMCLNRGEPYGMDDLLARIDKIEDEGEKFDELVDAYTAHFGGSPDTWLFRGLPYEEKNKRLETCIRENKEQETPYEDNPDSVF